MRLDLLDTLQGKTDRDESYLMSYGPARISVLGVGFETSLSVYYANYRLG